jgi:hypothetical protein
MLVKRQRLWPGLLKHFNEGNRKQAEERPQHCEAYHSRGQGPADVGKSTTAQEAFWAPKVDKPQTGREAMPLSPALSL